MKVLIAPDSFKGSLASYEICQYIENGIKKVSKQIETIKSPMGDGGEGTLEAIVEANNGEYISAEVLNPIFDKIDAVYGVYENGKTAIIEMAKASGLTLIEKKNQNPMNTTSYGTGELIKDALNRGCEKIVVGIGGSATNDCGIGMLSALGAKFLDKHKEKIIPIGRNLKEIHTIDFSELDKRCYNCEFVVACDVENPLIGNKGAVRVYAKQKGANNEDMDILETGTKLFGELLEKECNKSIVNLKGAGAAGGLGAALMGVLGANRKNGINLVIDEVKLEDKIIDVDLVITGEGMLDSQTFFGKTPYGVAKIAKKYNKPVIAIAGGIKEDNIEFYKNGFTGVFSITNRPMTLIESVENCGILIENLVENIVNVMLLVNGKKEHINGNGAKNAQK